MHFCWQPRKEFTTESELSVHGGLGGLAEEEGIGDGLWLWSVGDVKAGVKLPHSKLGRGGFALEAGTKTSLMKVSMGVGVVLAAERGSMPTQTPVLKP